MGGERNRRFIIQENVNGAWITLAKIVEQNKAANHLKDLKKVAPESSPGSRYRTIREGELGDY